MRSPNFEERCSRVLGRFLATAVMCFLPGLGMAADWEKVAGPPGVDVTVIYKGGDILYAGTEKLGVYRSTDNGTSWSPANVGIERTHVHDIIASGPNVLAATAASQCPSSLNVFRSTDNGLTWTPTSGLGGLVTLSFAAKGSFIYAGVYNPLGNGVWRSADNGNTWQAVPSIIHSGDQVFVSGNAILVAEDNFIWRSIDEGATWDVVEQFALTGIHDFARVGTRLFAAATTGYESSDDNGATWNFTFFTGGVGSFGSDGTTAYLGSSSKVYRSTDFGASWQDHSSGLGQGVVHAMFVDGDMVFAGTPNDTSGIYRSTNRAVNWSAAAAGLPFASNVRSMTTFNGSIFAGLDGGGIYRSNDRGATWAKVDAANPLIRQRLVIDLFATSNTIFAITDDGLFRSTDGGVTFQRSHNGFPTNIRIQGYSLTQSGGNILVSASVVVTVSEAIDGIWYSSDNGDSWHQATITNNVVAVTAVASDGSTRAYAGVYTESSFTTGLYISTNSGVSWVPNPAFMVDIENMAVRGNNVLASTLFNAYYSTDFGELNWTHNSLPGSVPLGTGVDTYTIVGTSIYAGNEGMYVSTQGGANWQPIRTGFPTCPLPIVIASTADDRYLYAGTVGEGIWRKRFDNIAAAVPFDYDGDGRTDVSVFRPAEGAWYLLRSRDGFFVSSFGLSTDTIVPADYDGDGKTDIAVYRPSAGTWYRLNSSNGTLTVVPFGVAEDLPTPADYDGDGLADTSVFRPSSGIWYRLNSSNGSFAAVQFGISTDKPTIGDFDGDGQADIAVYRPSNGTWYRLNSSNGAFVARAFGTSTDLITPADFDGDGRTDLAVYGPDEGNWYVDRSTQGFLALQFGVASDLPAAGDFDGDGKADISVFRPSTGYWYRLNSSNSEFVSQPFGSTGDRPTPAAFRY
jgi:photosystem II stability/assembly factor-like uncharacterized protein